MQDRKSGTRERSAESGAIALATPQVISSGGVDAAQAYVGPTTLPASARPAADMAKIRVNEPHSTVAVKKAIKPPSRGAPTAGRGAIDAPLDRPAGAFQPIMADPALIMEWAARREHPTQGSPHAPAPTGVTAEGNESSRWAATEKIDRSALPSSLAPKLQEEPSKTPASGAAAGQGAVKDAGVLRGFWGPLVIAVMGGVGIGLLAINFLFLKRPSSAEQSVPSLRETTVAPTSLPSSPSSPSLTTPPELPLPSGSATPSASVVPSVT